MAFHMQVKCKAIFTRSKLLPRHSLQTAPKRTQIIQFYFSPQNITFNHDPGTSDDSGRASERLTTSSVAQRDQDSSRDRLSDVSVTPYVYILLSACYHLSQHKEKRKRKRKSSCSFIFSYLVPTHTGKQSMQFRERIYRKYHRGIH